MLGLGFENDRARGPSISVSHGILNGGDRVNITGI